MKGEILRTSGSSSSMSSALARCAASSAFNLCRVVILWSCFGCFLTLRDDNLGGSWRTFRDSFASGLDAFVAIALFALEHRRTSLRPSRTRASAGHAASYRSARYVNSFAAELTLAYSPWSAYGEQYLVLNILLGSLGQLRPGAAAA